LINQIREESIKKISNKYESEPEHALQVKKLALIIFDKTKGMIHNMSDNEKDLLEAGAILHDIGYYICAKGHNKNSYNLITQEDLQGFSMLEKEIIGNIARYHRGKLPKAKHSCYTELPDEAKSVVNKLGAFARLADGLDGSHCNVVDDLDFSYDTFTNELLVILKLNTPDYTLEILKAEDKKDFFEKIFNLKNRVNFQIHKI